MADYQVSQKPVWQKLQLKPGHRAAIVSAPESYGASLADVPTDVEISKTLDGKFDFVQYFARTRAELEQAGPKLKEAMKSGGLLWVSYPKGKALQTDLNRDIVAGMLKEIGLQAVSQIAIDEVWSALRFKKI